MRLISAFAMAASLAAGASGAADASNFYMRQQLMKAVPSGTTTPTNATNPTTATPPTVTPGSWTYSAWIDATACVTNAKQQSRTATCTADGATVADSRCASAKDAVSRSIACTPTGTWQYSAWADTSACISSSKSQARNASCIDGGTAAPATQCAAAAGPTTQSVSCTPTGVWNDSDNPWVDTSQCLNSSKTQSKDVFCSNGGQRVADTQCAATKPASTRSTSCTPDGTWKYGPWTPATPQTTCIGGTQAQKRDSACEIGGTSAIGSGTTVEAGHCGTRDPVTNTSGSCTAPSAFTCDTMVNRSFSGESGEIGPANVVGSSLADVVAKGKAYCEARTTTETSQLRSCGINVAADGLSGRVYYSKFDSARTGLGNTALWGGNCVRN